MIRERRARTTQVNHERWLVSYADFVTLLFAFFVVLYASAQVDRQRALQLSQAIRSGFQQLGVLENDMGRTSTVSPISSAPPQNGAGSRKEAFADISSELQRALAAEIARKQVLLHMERDGLVVTLREVGFFDSGSATIRAGAEKPLARLATILRAHGCAVRIEGHTDNVPIHNSRYVSNWELSTARASGLVRVLAEDYGVSPDLLSAAGYGEFHPASNNDTSEGRASNRRVDLVILNSQPTLPLSASNAGGLPPVPR